MKSMMTLFACDMADRTLPMGAPKANALLIEALRSHPLVRHLGVSTDRVVRTGAELLVVDAPTGKPFLDVAGAKYSVVVRHGDIPIGHCAFDAFDGDPDNVAMLLPSAHALRFLPRLRHHVQWMSLEQPPDVAPRRGSKVLHARAFDWFKDSHLALRVARAAPDLQFVFRCFARPASGVEVPGNVTLLDQTVGPELWDDVGALLLTSRMETFCLTAYEAMGRGIPVAYHHELGAIDEWGHGGGLPCDTPDAFASALRIMLNEYEPKHRSAVQAIAWKAHVRAREQLSEWLAVASERCSR